MTPRAARHPAPIEIALYQPDIPQNTGTLLRLGACLGVPLHIIEPAGFALTDRRLRRAGMDYLAAAARHHHDDWHAFLGWAHAHGRRIVLLTTKTRRSYLDLTYLKGDVLLLGQESAGVPQTVAAAVDARVCIPMRAGARSLNVAVSAAMATGEALRQLEAFPAFGSKGEGKGDECDRLGPEGEQCGSDG